MDDLHIYLLDLISFVASFVDNDFLCRTHLKTRGSYVDKTVKRMLCLELTIGFEMDINGSYE